MFDLLCQSPCLLSQKENAITFVNGIVESVIREFSDAERFPAFAALLTNILARSFFRSLPSWTKHLLMMHTLLAARIITFIHQKVLIWHGSLTAMC